MVPWKEEAVFTVLGATVQCGACAKQYRTSNSGPCCPACKSTNHLLLECRLCHHTIGVLGQGDMIICAKCGGGMEPSAAIIPTVICRDCKRRYSPVENSGCPQCHSLRRVNDAKEEVNHPPHYGGDTTYEAIKVIEAWELGFNLGNTVKYISRAGKKQDILKDLKKAAWYLNREITNVEETHANSAQRETAE